jgi:hypothetical protein
LLAFTSLWVKPLIKLPRIQELKLAKIRQSFDTFLSSLIILNIKTNVKNFWEPFRKSVIAAVRLRKMPNGMFTGP